MDRAIEILELVQPHVASVETFAVTAEAVNVSYRAGKLRSSEVQETSGISIRAINDGKLGFYSTTDLTDKDKLLESTLNSAQFGGEATFEFAQAAQGEVFDGYSKEAAQLDIQELAEQDSRDVGGAHGQAGMAGFGLFHAVHRQRADRIRHPVVPGAVHGGFHGCGRRS